MQQTKSYWRLLAVTGVVSAFIASACVVTTDDDDGSAGAGGSGTAGASAGAPAAGTGTAGTGTAGTGTAGSPAGGAGSTPFQCDTGESGAPGTPNSCVPSDSSDPCQKCIQDSCCDLYEFCYATDPGNQCGWGGPATLPDGTKNDGGEILCIQLCLQKVTEASGTDPESSDIETCANNCATTTSNGATKECGSIIGQQTSDLVACLSEHCSPKCFGPLQ